VVIDVANGKFHCAFKNTRCNQLNFPDNRKKFAGIGGGLIFLHHIQKKPGLSLTVYILPLVAMKYFHYCAKPK
jgi:hypothetical protein